MPLQTDLRPPSMPPAVAQEKLVQLLPCHTLHLDRVFARPLQIAHRFRLSLGNRDFHQIA